LLIGDESLGELQAIHDVGLESLWLPLPLQPGQQPLGGHGVAGLPSSGRQQMEPEVVELEAESVDVVQEPQSLAWLAALPTRADEGVDDHHARVIVGTTYSRRGEKSFVGGERLLDVPTPAECGDEGRGAKASRVLIVEMGSLLDFVLLAKSHRAPAVVGRDWSRAPARS